MKKINYITILSLIICTICSCQKESDSRNELPLPTSSDSIYLDKIYITSGSITIDTFETVTITYDAQKRVTSMVSSFSASSTITKRSYTYSYIGSDTLPFKTTFYLEENSGKDTAITFHFYDATSRNLKDSSLTSHFSLISGNYSIRNIITNYTYDVGKKYAYGINEFPLSPTNNYIRKDTATVDANDNITLTKGYFPDFPGPGFVQRTNSVIAYDNKINPFRLLSNFKAHQQLPSGETLFFDYLPNNNITSTTETQGGSSPLTTTYTYTYKTNGLPSVADVIFDGTDFYKIYYTYKKL